MTADDATVYPPAPPLLDRYRVERALGEGGLGTVVQAYDTRLKRTVAIKTLRRNLLASDPVRARALEERFAREAEAGSRMGNHPNIVAVYDLVIAPDHTQYLILEFVAGGTLVDHLKRGALPLADALRLATDAAKGLGAAHAVGIVHRDVKPANLFVAADGRCQVGDFGIAQIDDLSGRTHTAVGHPGTPLYMSPEQSSSTGYVRPATDQYSLGLVLFEMLVGTAYKRLGTREVGAALGDLPPGVAAVIERMTALDPDARYPDMEAVIGALAMAAEAERTNPFPLPLPGKDDTMPFAPAIVPVAPSPVGPHDRAATGSGSVISRRTVLVAGAIVAVAGIGGVIVAATRQPGPPTVATATVQPGTTETPLPTPTTLRVSLGGTATTMNATAVLSPAASPTVPTAPANATIPATMRPAPSPVSATTIPPTLNQPRTSPPPITTPPPPPTATLMPPTATPQLLRPGTVVVPTAYPAVVSRVQDRFRDLPGGTSAVFTDLGTNASAVVEEDHGVPAAALIDLFVIAETYHQVEAKRLALDTTLSVPTNPVGGTGVLQRRAGGTTTVGECITLITTESDNLATNLLMDRVGMENVNATIRVHGLLNTQLRRHLGDEDARTRGIDNVTTARDMALFFTLIARGQVYTPYVSTALITAMGQQQKPEWDYLGSAIMPRPLIVHMPGQLPPANGDTGVLHDVGIIYHGTNDAYVLAFLNQSTTPNREIGMQASRLSADVYRIVTGQ